MPSSALTGRFNWDEVEDDCAFVLSRYFHREAFDCKPITKHEHYTQRELVAELFGYQLWAADFLPRLGQQATQTVRRGVTPRFVAAELIAWLNKHKIIRPGYTTLQELISETLSTEHRRLGGLEDISIHRLNAMHGANSALSDVVQYRGSIDDTLTSIDLAVALCNRRLPSREATFLCLHAPNGVTNHFGCIAIKAAGDLGFDEALHFGREIDMHSHGQNPS